MKWTSLSDFIAMGGYGVYVWGSYALALAFMMIEPWLAVRRHRHALRALDETNSQD
jgi:heme exporter protein D